MPINENTLEQAVIAQLQGNGYEYLYGPDIDRDYHEVILKDYFETAMYKINPKITVDIVGEAYKTIRNLGLLKLEDMNAAFHKYLIEGVPVNYRVSGELRTYTVKLIDFAEPERNEFYVVNQYTVIEYKNKRPDVLVFVNGIPLVLFELKNITNEEITIENAYKQVKNYQMDIPSLFYYNAFNVISDGLDTRMGTITSDFTRYMVWKSENGEKPEEGGLNYFSVLLNGVFPKARLLDLIRNFIVFQNSKGRTIKIIAGYHQYFAVRKAVERTRNALEEHSRKVGVVWHTQGSGKSLSMVFYTGCIVSNPEFNNPTIVVLTDRNDLDNQLFGSFVSSSKLLLRQTPKQARSREHLKELLRVKAGGIIFTTIQKFEESSEVLSERSNIIFMADEAHRSQYGLDGKLDRETGEWKYGMAKYMRDSLPNATFIGFTGTPIDFDDRSTVEVFGEYIDIYDMTQAVEDGATVPIYYENRTAKIKLNEELLKKIDAEYEKMAGEASETAIEKSKSDLSTIEAIIGSKERLSLLADDMIAHYEDRQYVLTGKAMIVCMSRRIAINLYRIILEKRPEWKQKVKVVLTSSNQDDEDWHDIIGNKAYRDGLMLEFKDDTSEFKIAIVVDMWLTGFDVPSMATMYIDKPMKGHNLMQAIARVNRVYKDKEAGLVVDYIGMAAELRSALSQYTKRDQDKIPDLGQALSIAIEKLEIMRDMFYGFDYSDFFGVDDSVRLAVIANGVNFALGMEEDEQKSFIREATALSQAETLCRSMLETRLKQEIEFFKCVKAGICKTAGRMGITTNEINARIMKLLEQAIEQDGVYNIFAEAGKKNPEISILSEEYMEKIRRMKHKNIAAEMLRKLLEDNIRVFARTGVVKSQLFSEKMQKLLKMYNNRLITSAEVIEELLNLSKEMTEAYKAGDEKGLSVEELAFYDALVSDPEVLRKMQDKVLVEMAQELTELIRKSRTVDWDKKESARAYMRTQVKHLLRKYKYPPEKARGAVDIVIKQAELMSSNIETGVVNYDFHSGDNSLMVAEETTPYHVNEKL
ncbi:type I restriction endonuclease subunit R [Acetatifactor muris]|uniref:Type I restriction enzyme endonuclease subunit n=1 Tax=Acetatifactor muris TaxID=879566 RepID=A0A2K4ZC21_9FIRM|nr:type I restriction endonuclease subunit R [Acetatifactor muris]MCR2046420.1 type I restriction endonuclease subunit R [Acetatifactor muris]SOY28011.1 Type-1 restriction enzyme R protein [Acetatifactor muris]